MIGLRSLEFGPVVIESETAEYLKVTLETDADPTGGAVEWAFSAGSRSDPGSWVAGQWASAGWSSRTGRVDVLSPLVGSGQAADVAQGSTYDVFVRFAVGSELPVSYVGQLTVR